MKTTLPAPTDPPVAAPPARTAALVALAIALGSFLAYAPALGLGFTFWDDEAYVTGNPLIRDLSAAGLLRIFSTPHEINYHPLALLTYALEHRFFGLDPLPYHLTNVLLHVANAVLLLRLLLLLTGRLLPAALVALAWGIHPLHVESVAWVAERRDVLFTFFFLASLIVYLRDKGAAGFSWRRGGSLLLFVLACLAKAMAVTLPAVLLLVEHRRAGGRPPREAMARLVPFALVALGFVLLTARIRAGAGDLTAGKAGDLLHNALVASYALLFYVRATILPRGLSALYPYPEASGLALPWPYLLAPLALAGLVVLVLLARRNRDVVFGSLFYLATIAPAAQLVPTGLGVVADRYAYLPSAGILLVLGSLLVRGADRLRRRSPRATGALFAGLAAAAGIALGSLTWERTRVWRSDRALWEDVLRRFPSSTIAHTNLAAALIREDLTEPAREHLLATLQALPRDCRARFNLGLLFEREGRLAEAAGEYGVAAEACPGYAEARLALAEVLEGAGRDAEAEPHRRAAVAAAPRDPVARALLGANLLRQGKAEEALPHLAELVRLQPGVAPNHNNFGVALAQSGRLAEAAAQFREALRLAPGYAEPRVNLEAILPLLEP